METDDLYFDQVEDIPKLQFLSLEKLLSLMTKMCYWPFHQTRRTSIQPLLMELTKQLKKSRRNNPNIKTLFWAFIKKGMANLPPVVHQ